MNLTVQVLTKIGFSVLAYINFSVNVVKCTYKKFNKIFLRVLIHQ